MKRFLLIAVISTMVWGSCVSSLHATRLVTRMIASARPGSGLHAPSGLSGINGLTSPTYTTATSTTMTLTWTPSQGATSYLVERETLSTGTWTTLGTSTSTSYQDTTYGYGGFHYRVSASNSTGTSTPCAEYPQSTYVIIDLGANTVPMKITNGGNILCHSGYLGLASYGRGYSVWQNGITLTLQPMDASTLGWDASDIADSINASGTVVGAQVVGLESVPNGNPLLNGTGPYNFSIGQNDVLNLATWTLSASANTSSVAAQLTPPPVIYSYQDAYTDRYAAGYSSNLGFEGLVGDDPDPDNFPSPLVTPVSTWTVQVAGSFFGTGVGADFLDGFKNQTRLGNTTADIPTDSITGRSVFPLLANTSDDVFTEVITYPSFTATYNFYFDGQSFPSQLGLLAMSNRNALQKVNVLAQTFGGNGNGYPLWVCWQTDGSSAITIPLNVSGAAFPIGVNAMTNTIVASGTTQNIPATQLIGDAWVFQGGNAEAGCIWQLNPSSGSSSTPAFAAAQMLGDLVPSGTSTTPSPWSEISALSINDSGSIVGLALKDENGDGIFDPGTYDLTTGIWSGPDQFHSVLLLPIQSRVVNRDDPTQTWANNVLQNGLVPVYGGIKAGDMVGWKFAGTDSWSTATFTWSVTDSAGNPVTDFNGTTITGPSGPGINEWRIATWTAGGNDPHNQWLTWKPGTYTIKCVIGSSTCTFQQTVGTRANDVLVIGWINPAGVSLPTAGCDADVLSTFPVSGTFGGTLAKIYASSYLADLAAGSTLRPAGSGSLNAADDTYILNWLFHFAANPTPPTSFADEPTLDTFISTHTNYKLINRLQLRWQETSAKFTGSPFQIKNGVTVSIGTTVDPIWGLPVPGAAGPANGRIRITTGDTYNQMNDGTPDFAGVLVINTLMSPLKWSDIGSKLSEGPVTGSSYDLKQQVYPTYNIYVRNSDGSFTQVDTRPQAANPSANFSATPYPGSSIPAWIIP